MMFIFFDDLGEFMNLYFRDIYTYYVENKLNELLEIVGCFLTREVEFSGACLQLLIHYFEVLKLGCHWLFVPW